MGKTKISKHLNIQSIGICKFLDLDNNINIAFIVIRFPLCFNPVRTMDGTCGLGFVGLPKPLFLKWTKIEDIEYLVSFVK